MTIALSNMGWRRIVTAALGVALVFTLMMPAPSAHAQTADDLQDQIDELLAVIAQLQAQLGNNANVAGNCSVTWTRNLGIGSTGPDVRALQQFLNRDTATRLAVSGAGSPGMETQYYGPITAAAVSKFQVKYRSEILTPLGLVNPTGYFGSSSRAQANDLCVDLDLPDTDDGDEDDELSGGEASLENFEVNDEDSSLSEGDDTEVMNVEFDVEDGDVEINRIDIAFDHVSGGDDEPWDVFDSISVMVDGETVAEMDVNDEDEWDEDDPESGDYRIRITDLDEWIVREGETAEFTVALSVAGSVDDAETGVDWEIFIPDEGIRATDSLNINHYTGDTDDVVSFDIEEEGGEDELTVRSSSEDPEATTLQLDDNETSDWLTVFAFELDTDDSQNDIEIENLPIDVELSTSTYESLVNDARIIVDGEEFDDYTVTGENNATSTVTFEFDNEDFVIEAGESVTVEFQLEFDALDDADLQGTTLESSIDGDDIDAEGADELDDDQTGGTASSELHTLRTQGVTLSSAETTTDVRDNDTAADTGIFTIEFEVTAFEEDVYISRSAASGTTMAAAGVNFLVEDAEGDQVAAGTENAALSSTAPVSGDRFRVAEGETETFTLTVSYTPTGDDFYRVQLYSVNFNDTNAAPDVQQRALPEQNYETDFANLDA